MNLDLARAVADAVLYEGYLLYPYRASSAKNTVRWQFGVLSPPGAAEAGVGEESGLSMECLLDFGGAVESADHADPPSAPGLVLHLRFLQLQRRQVYDAGDRPVAELIVGGTTWTSWDEAVPQEVTLHWDLADLAAGTDTEVGVDGGTDVEPLDTASDGSAAHLRRRRWPLTARVQASTEPVGNLARLQVRVDNLTRSTNDGSTSAHDVAIRRSLIGAHLIVEAHGPAFVSLLDPPAGAAEAASACVQHRCWPVLTGAPGDRDLVLGSPIILYDYPEIAGESPGALFDGCEIDEILTLRVMTMTEQEKAEARATDPRAADIIDRCEAMSPETLQQLHGTLRDPHAFDAPASADVRGQDPPSFDPAPFNTGGSPWWDPAVDAAVRPDRDAVTVRGVRVARDSLVRVHPSRRADAQDLFFADQVARVRAVLSDVDGETHIALVLADDPAADLHEAAGRYFYFSPDEIEPLDPLPVARQEERTR